MNECAARTESEKLANNQIDGIGQDEEVPKNELVVGALKAQNKEVGAERELQQNVYGDNGLNADK